MADLQNKTSNTETTASTVPKTMDDIISSIYDKYYSSKTIEEVVTLAKTSFKDIMIWAEATLKGFISTKDNKPLACPCVSFIYDSAACTLTARLVAGHICESIATSTAPLISKSKFYEKYDSNLWNVYQSILLNLMINAGYECMANSMLVWERELYNFNLLEGYESDFE